MENNQNFFDKNTILALALTLVIFVGWSHYMEKNYGGQENAVSSSPANGSVASTEEGVGASSSDSEIKPQVTKNKIPSQEKETAKVEQNLEYNSENLSFVLSSEGMSLSNIRINTYTDRENNPVQVAKVAKEDASFSTWMKGRSEPVHFKLERLNEFEFSGTAHVDGVNLVKRYSVDPQKYTVSTTISISSDKELPSIVTKMSDEILPQPKGSFLAPSMERQEIYAVHKKGQERKVFHNEEEVDFDFKEASLLAISSHYFSTAILDSSNVIPDLKAKSSNRDPHMLRASLEYPSFAGTKEMSLSYKIFLGPKSIDLLQSVDPKLKNVIDLGWFGFIGEPLLKFLKLLFGWLNNWGFAIIALTLVVRLLVLPFNMMSYKSMKKMQEIQPALKEVREKYAKDQVRMNQEVMALMRESKVNPAGGCLPMLLQLPIFIALYRVLGESVELYKAPFLFWITDLSLKDPYYILPIALSAAMFVQSKITPSTLDPSQQKVMMLMPVFFGLLMISLPSGLTLYIFVSTLFGILQQQLFMKRA